MATLPSDDSVAVSVDAEMDIASVSTQKPVHVDMLPLLAPLEGTPKVSPYVITRMYARSGNGNGDGAWGSHVVPEVGLHVVPTTLHRASASHDCPSSQSSAEEHTMASTASSSKLSMIEVSELASWAAL